ncbi:CPSF A subunit region containing protein [Leishmania donovani]|nr:CPSF A subunit region containing protein [Leishmania donovani]VDZ41963.1 CPSF_A_subunit_region_containing_protein_putative/Pfam:PF03178 [Leishmania donovani]
MSHNSVAEGEDGGTGADAAAVVPVNETLLYHQTLIPTQNVTHAIEGSFTLPDANDLVLIRHNVLELWRLYAENANGGVECVCRTPLMSAVYAAVAVPTSASSMAKAGGAGSAASPGGNVAAVLDDATTTAHRSGVHYLAVTSETGYVTLLRYQLDEPPVPTRLSYGDDSDEGNEGIGGSSGASGGATMLVTTSLKGRFIKVSEVCLGRSGARLTVPGARMVVDTAGTALLITALMRTKTLVPITANETWDPVKSVNVGQDDDDAESDADGDDEDEEADNDDAGEHQRRGPVTGRELRAARRRRAAKARRANGAINLGTPIEMQRQTVLYSACALDGYLDHAVFAVLEEEIVEARDAAAASASNPANAAAAAAEASGGTFLKSSGGPNAVVQRHKHFVLYAYVPSLKQVQRTQLVHVPATAHRLIAVPAAPYGPGGVLVCTDTELIWYDVSATQQQQQNSAAAANGRVGVFKCTYAFPRRLDCTEILYDPSIIQHTLTCFGRRFFMLLQDEQGDVYRVFLEAGDVQRAYEALRTRELAQANPELFLQQQLAANGGVAPAPALPPVPNPLSVHYFDTLPPSSAMALFRRGFLFIGNEAGPLHGLYKIKSNGYTADREYIVKRVRRERALPMALQMSSSSKAEKAKAEVEDGAVKKEGDGADRKRPRAAEAAGAAGKPEPQDPTAPATSSGSAASSTLPRTKTEPTDGDGNSPASAAASATAMRSPAPSSATAPAFKTPMEVRVIKVYQPHRRPQHVVQLQSFPNTPAITSFTSHLTASTSAAATASDGADHLTGFGGGPAPAPAPEQSSEQPEIYFSYVGGRGGESVLVQARYGYAAKLEGRQMLPTVFSFVIPLPSALSMQSLARQQQAAIEAAAVAAVTRRADEKTLRGTGGAARQHAQRLKALRQLAATVSGARDQVCTDRVLLCTRQGTTVYRIGSTVEQDTSLSFITAERTLAATTLQYGCGYVQVTPRGINVLSCVDTAAGGGGRLDAAGRRVHGSGDSAGASSVVPASWTHPHGNTVLAAAVTPTTVLLSFHQRGGIASFDFGLAGTELQQRDVLPTFPLAPVVALLQPPASAVSEALQRELQALLWNSSVASPSSAEAAAAASAAAAAAAAQTEQLAAIATVNHEVYLVHPRKLREPLEKITCRRSGTLDAGSSSAAEVTITSLLLTYLGDTRGSSDAAAALIGGAGPRGGRGGNRVRGDVTAAAGRRQLFLFVGHSDGMVTRCELNPSSAKVTATAELWCGARPCQLVAGDGETFCYIVSGERTWRCEMQERTVRMAPYSFPTRPTSFARFVLPSRVSAATANGSDSAAPGAQDSANEEDENALAAVESITLVPREQQQEVVIAVQNRELALYVSNIGAGGGGAGGGGGGGPGSGGVEYSFQHHPLPLAGRRLLQHPTRPAYLILCGVEHRSHGRLEVERHRAEDRAFLTARVAGTTQAEDRGALYAEGLYGGIPYTAPQRSLGRPNAYHSTLQLYHRDAQRLLPPIHFEPNEAITSVAVGSFFKEFGREPVVIVGTASSYTHGAGCGTAASWRHGFLRTFRCASGSVGGGGGGGADLLLRLELLHSTYLRPDETGGSGNSSSSGRDRRSGANSSAVAAGGGGNGVGGDAKPDYPSALCICEPVGILLVGMGAAQGLRIYSWGKEHLLRRRHLTSTPGQRITAIDYVFASPPGSRNLNTRNVSFFAADLYQCPYGDAEGMRMAREKQLLIICGTVNASVFIAALQPGYPAPAAAHGAAGATTAATPSFLLQIMTDSVPRHITSVVAVDERTIAASDRFGTVVFLRIPETTRTQFAQPVHQLQEAELIAEETYLRTKQTFREVARHHVGELVTALHVQPYDPSQGTDTALATKIVYYSTALGSIGAYVPLLSEEDGALAAYLQPLLHSHMRPLLGPPPALSPASYLSHHVVDGDVAQLLSGGATTPFSAAAKDDIADELERQVKMEAARRNVLGLPKRTLPSLTELIAKQRALLTLPL